MKPDEQNLVSTFQNTYMAMNHEFIQEKNQGTMLENNEGHGHALGVDVQHGTEPFCSEESTTMCAKLANDPIQVTTHKTSLK